MEQTDYATYRSQQRFFDSKDGPLAFIDHGSGPVILLLHGVPTSGWLYRHMISDLTSQGFRVIVPDMLGYGSSASPDLYEVYHEQEHASRILALMSFLNIPQWHHVMHDAGGLWTWPLFALSPKSILSLTALNCIAFEAGFKPPMRFKRGFLAKAVMWTYHNGITTSMMLKGLFKSGLNKNSLTKQDIEGYKKPLLEGKTKGMYYFFTQTCNKLPLISKFTDKVDVPAQIIWGKNDSFLKLQPQRDEFTAFLSVGDDSVHILDAKHFIQEEKPKEIVTLITKFLKELV
ncbi:MAG: alpha/beta hydrolase [Gilvibacter sp.]